MNIRIFLLNENPGNTTKRKQDTLKYVFGKYLPDSESVLCYPSLKDGITKISEAFKDSHVVIFLADEAIYAETKKRLAKSFALSMEISGDLRAKALRTLGGRLESGTAEEYAHCAVPHNSRIFSLTDGLYSGFSVASGNQTIIYLPLEDGRTDYILTKQVIPYINAAYHTDLSFSSYRAFHLEKLQSALNDNAVTLGLADTNTSSYFKDYISVNSSVSERVKDSGRNEKRGSASPEDYIVNISILAKEFTSATYGVAMSNAYYVGDDANAEKIIYLAVTSDLKTSVREIRSVPGEEVEAFLARASGDLCVFAADVIETAEETDKESEKIKDKKIKKYKLAIAVVAIIAACLIIATVLIFSKYGYSLNEWFADFKDFILPGQAPVETTIIYID